jgi:RNA polymerase sigma factor (sigma-70 family)
MGGTAESLTGLLVAYHRNEAGASDRLFVRICNRMRGQAQRFLERDFRRLRNLVEPDDVVDEFLIRFEAALAKAKPASTQHCYALANRTVRFVLLDMIRSFYGPDRPQFNDLYPAIDQAGTTTFDPESNAKWTRLHDAVAELPDDEWIVFYLRWYEGSTLEEMAQEIGVNRQTVRNRLDSAIALLKDPLEDLLPQLEEFSNLDDLV